MIDDKYALYTVEQIDSKKRHFEYGYNKEHDIVVISKTGKISGEIYNINGVRIALPEKPDKIHKGENRWVAQEYPKELAKIKTIFDWNRKDNAFKAKYVDFIEQEFERRDKGHWFMNNGQPTYIPGSHYMYLQWSKIDVGLPDFREANRVFWLFWEACKADNRSFGMVYLKNRRSGFSFMSSSEVSNEATLAQDSRLGILSKTGNDAKKMFTDKVVPIVNNYPFFFQPVRDGMTNPKTELAFRVPASKITKKNMEEVHGEEMEGLDTSIDWKNTSDNSYDGEKLLMLVHDECFSPGTKILMSDYTFRNIEDINIGDKVMVDGGKIKTVMKTTNGYTNMYKVKQKWSEDYIVSENHRLILDRYYSSSKREEVIMTPREYLDLPKNTRRHTFSVKAKPFDGDDSGISIPPYLLGLWVGDGMSRYFCILVYKKDPEILDYLGKIAQIYNIELSINKVNGCEGLLRVTLLKSTDYLREIGVYKNKHIPTSYMTSSLESRLQLLAGIIDTDGYAVKGKGCYEIGMSRENLIHQIRTLALSCGLSCSNVSHGKSNYKTDVYSIRISGNISSVPCLVERKIFNDYTQAYTNRRCGMDIEELGVGEYYGIQVDADNDNDRRLILNDFTVTLNSGKWEKPENIKNNWRVTKTCLRLGSKIIGKCMMGSTVNALSKGGNNFKDLYIDSDPRRRSKNGQTKSGLYSLFIPMEWNFEGYIDEYGMPVFETPEEPIVGMDGEMIDTGVVEYWNNEVEALKSDSDALNEFYRQFPRTESHAFRDESKESLFNLTKIYSQIDYNDGLIKEKFLTRGSFHWKNGIQDSEVVWTPDRNGRFLVSWLPPLNLRNNVIVRNGKKYPGNDHLGKFGCDSYDISGVVGGGGSNGALHGMTAYHMDNAPVNEFFLEYVARPSTAEIFYEEVLMALVFYGMSILAENNKPRLLYHLKDRGYRGYSMNRPDKHISKLSKTELELGGIPNSSEDVRQAHATAIESYVEEYVGIDTEGTYRPQDEIGSMYFTRTLEDWAKFEFNNRTKYDASISSGLAIMANRRHKFSQEVKKSKINVNFARYNNNGGQSQINKYG